MNALAFLPHSAVLSTLGWTLIHFLWQGAAVGMIYALMRRLLRNKAPTTRYNLAMATLMVLAILPIVTFLQLFHAPTSGSSAITLSNLTVVIAAGARPQATTFMSWLNAMHLWLKPLVSWAVLIWFLGVLIMTLRIGRGWWHAHYLRRTANFPPLPEWSNIVRGLSTRLGIRQLVRLAISSQVHVPSVIGWIKPIILLPPSVMSGLTPLQIELILAHELAHVRRLDYLWNLLQVLAETLLFYHPVVRWVSNHARVEREQCCDDMVVALHGNPLAYARALTELEQLRNPRAALMLGANGGQLLDRIHRLLGRSPAGVPAAWSPLLLAACLVIVGSLISTSQVRAPWHAALTARYSLTGQYIKSTPAPANLPFRLLPTRIIQASAMQSDPRLIRSLGSISAVHIPRPMTPVALDVPRSPPPATVVAAHQKTAPARSGGDVIFRDDPEYPVLALERGVEGYAKIEFTLTPEAEITNVRTVKVSGTQLFGEAAMRAIRKWKFTPVTVSGKPVSQQMTVDFVFRLHAAVTQGDSPCKIPLGYHVCAD